MNNWSGGFQNGERSEGFEKYGSIVLVMVVEKMIAINEMSTRTVIADWRPVLVVQVHAVH